MKYVQESIRRDLDRAELSTQASGLLYCDLLPLRSQVRSHCAANLFYTWAAIADFRCWILTGRWFRANVSAENNNQEPMMMIQRCRELDK